jgi:cytochrome c oxidase cbb3-type subunit I/II
MYSDFLSNLHFGVVNWLLLLPQLLPLGSIFKEYARIRMAYWCCNNHNLGGYGINMLEPVKRRPLYVAIWFIWPLLLQLLFYIFNNLNYLFCGRVTLFVEFKDALVQWWYGHNTVAFLDDAVFWIDVLLCSGSKIVPYILIDCLLFTLVVDLFYTFGHGPRHLLYSALPSNKKFRNWYFQSCY